MNAGSLVVEQIIEDRVVELLRAFKDKPLHEIEKEFGEKYKVHITMDTMHKIYSFWQGRSQYNHKFLYGELQKQEWWQPIQDLLESQTNKDVANFIYNHWKKAGNK